jgi:poly-D-alanine transfer protein DltD
MKLPHLVPALVAVTLAGCLLAAFDFHARTVEDGYVHALAGDTFHQKSLGNAIQKATLRQPDLLPVYGSSEVLDWRFHAVNGFTQGCEMSCLCSRGGS